jgi:hypothetical protein
MTRPTSSAPILMAAGLMFTLWGAVTSWILSAAGLIAIGIGAARWIKDSRHAN